jgi:enamine deaminase RidA (YjgF/YER057c/UK114 family)
MSDRQHRSRPDPRALLPSGWPKPKGYANGIKARGEMIFVAGQIGWDETGQFAAGFVAQTRKALENVVAVLASGGAGPEHIVRLTWYVRDMPAYRASLAEVGEAYRAVIGRNYPAMALVEVKSLVELDALVEIEATAVVPD